MSRMNLFIRMEFNRTGEHFIRTGAHGKKLPVKAKRAPSKRKKAPSKKKFLLGDILLGGVYKSKFLGGKLPHIYIYI